jgi:hypothetical protein
MGQLDSTCTAPPVAFEVDGVDEDEAQQRIGDDAVVQQLRDLALRALAHPREGLSLTPGGYQIGYMDILAVINGCFDCKTMLAVR